MGSSQFGGAAVVEVKDPRTNPSRIMKPSHELILDYNYSSELSTNEHRIVINTKRLEIIHNPKLLKQKHQQRNSEQQTITPELAAKLSNEIIQFNKCAEIAFCRNVCDLNSVVSDDMKMFLIGRWSEMESSEDGCKFQVITMLLRDQVCQGEPQVELQNTESDDFNHEAYLTSEFNFPSLGRFSGNDLKFYSTLKASQISETNLSSQYDVDVSMDLLTKLFVDSEQFSVRFENRENSLGKLVSIFHDPLPLKPVSISHALEEVADTALKMSIDWSSMDRFIKQSQSDSQVFCAELIENYTKKNFTRHIKKAGTNEIKQTWKMSIGQLSFNLLVNKPNVYFMKRQDGSLVLANISIKLENQIKFGAERMTRAELLREWCTQRFSPDSITLRYRIDAMTLTILSITCITFEEIDKELVGRYQVQPNALMGNLMNVFACIQRLPPSGYIIQAKLEDLCKKLFIYKASEDGKHLFNEPWEISAVSSQKWIPIDESTPTFLHVQYNFSPCCFPCSNRKLSYIKKAPPITKQKKKTLRQPPPKSKQPAVPRKKNKKRKLKPQKSTNKVVNK